MSRYSLFALAFPLSAWALLAPAPPANSQRIQGRAVEAIRRMGGQVFYDYQRPMPHRPHSFDPKAKPKDPGAFHRVVCVGLRGSKVTDDDLRVLTGLPQLENLSLAGTGVTASGLAHLRGVKSLRVLDLGKTRTDDGGLAHLRGLTRLWQLFLNDTDVTDKGLAQLKNLTEIEEWLDLSGTRVTDNGLKHLVGLKKVRSINLRLTAVTAAGAKKLKDALPQADVSYGP